MQQQLEADDAQGPGLPNFWQDSQDKAQEADAAPESLPKLLKLNLDLLLVRSGLPHLYQLWRLQWCANFRQDSQKMVQAAPEPARSCPG